tara:strand:+ start:1600 stop:1902 length:303 start_codon:yes stop_codon:yes gene_type:complete
MPHRKAKLIRKPRHTQTPRERYLAHLKQLTSPTAIVIKKGGRNISEERQPMLDQAAALYLAVYDGLIPKSPVQHLNILFQDMARNPRKQGTDTAWPISNA